MNRDRIDWGTANIPSLFRKMFVPTLLGMLLASTMCIVDGAIVGRGVGSDALAAVNIVAPFFLITTGIGLMFGTGGSIVASIHLSKGNRKAANINITQALSVSLLLMTAVTALVMAFPESFARAMGCSDRLLPYVLDYMKWIIPAMPFGMLLHTGLFVLRLDGSPVFAMLCNAIPTVINGILDYVFVFPLEMGIEGAALATGLSEAIGAVMILLYLVFFTRTIRLYRLKLSGKSMALTLRNIGHQMRLGAPSIVGELAIACMVLTGNYAFIAWLGEDGVAAFSAACYCFPLMFMIGNAIAQSAQPIVSYNYGAGLFQRVRQTLRLSVIVAAVCGTLTMAGGIFGSHLIVSLFIPAAGNANRLAMQGMPYFSLSFLFFALNLVFIGYFQSIERFRTATVFMLLRGLFIVVPSFLLLPYLTGTIGLWLAVPLSELSTLAVIIAYYRSTERQKGE